MNTPLRHLLLTAPARAALLAVGAAALAAPTAAQVTTEVVITGSLAERAAVEAPYAITAVDRETLRGAGPLVNLSEALVRVPGLVVNNRWNYAQDLQVSSRGFGARAGFGVRGLRLYADGIPATGPDGQGQVTHFDLAGAERVEVLRGPFSVLFGNSSGGVISLISAPVRQREAEAAVDIGEFGFHQVRAAVAVPFEGGLSLKAGVSSLELDGFRPQSAARRDLANVRAAWQGANDRVVVSANYLDQPAQDPLGLTRQDFNADPRRTAAVALQFNTRKEATQTQAGASWRHRFDAGALREAQIAAYTGTRSVTQFLAIAPGTQANVRHGGGVIDFDRDFSGIDARVRLDWRPFELQLGAAVDRQQDARRGYENFTGTGPAQVLGVFGRLRRDENNEARSRDVYAQGEWTISKAVVLSGGVRSGTTRLSAKDAYLSNGDDSGATEYDYTNPVLGLRWQLAPSFNLHASAARGYESPTLGEIAYKPDNSSGLNFGLKAQRSRQYEVGAKWRGDGVSIDAAIFDVAAEDEIAVVLNAGGRSAFQNVGRTSRRGAELAIAWRLTPAWRAALSATSLDATYRDSFLTCAGIPCNAPTVRVPAGNRIAGTSRTTGFAELSWRDAGWGEFGVEVRGNARTAVNDANSDFAGGYAVIGLRWLKSFAVGGQARAEVLLRIDNAADRVHVGSVIVNEGNQRFFEPGPPRNALLALRLVGGW